MCLMLWTSFFTFDSIAKLFEEDTFYKVDEEAKFVLEDGLFAILYSWVDPVLPAW